MSSSFKCQIHGESAAVSVCAHLAEALPTGAVSGVNWAIDAQGQHHALCDACWTAPGSPADRIAASGTVQACVVCLSHAAASRGMHLTL